MYAEHSMRAELLALLAGLERAKQIGIGKLIIHMNNKTCIQLVLEEQLLSNDLRPLVNRCRVLMQERRGLIRLEHTHRESNRGVDWLANRGVNSEIQPIILDSPPPELRTILREDILGVATPRVIAS
ncbi:uncharacterized protein LOC141618410 [Silene latifolia]|uniref:uncharacterized protein LOC141618410 n=1 Tax=Silene latifolia TaxID=37657 RepID=UPI003D7811AF